LAERTRLQGDDATSLGGWIVVRWLRYWQYRPLRPDASFGESPVRGTVASAGGCRIREHIACAGTF